MSYQGTPQMTTTGAQIVQDKSGGPGGPRQWKFGLFDCCSSCGLCLKSTFCSCITFGETKAKLNNDSSCFCHGLLYGIALYLGVNCIIGGMTRGDIRSRHNIEGSCLGDYCTHMCCPVCALVQEHREVHEN